MLNKNRLAETSRGGREAMKARKGGTPLALLVALAANAWAGNIATDSAARLIQGTNASVRYQLYQSSSTATPQKVDAFMAPVLGAIKNGITTSLDPLTLGVLKDQA